MNSSYIQSRQNSNKDSDYIRDDADEIEQAIMEENKNVSFSLFIYLEKKKKENW